MVFRTKIMVRLSLHNYSIILKVPEKLQLINLINMSLAETVSCFWAYSKGYVRM